MCGSKGRNHCNVGAYVKAHISIARRYFLDPTMPQGAGMKDQQTYRQTLRHALAIAGGPVFLAAQLNVGVAELTRWVHGEDAIPDGVFLHAVDVIESGYARGKRIRTVSA